MGALRTTVVPRNLDYKQRLFGLSMADVPFVGIPAFLASGLGAVFGFSSLWTPISALAALTAVLFLRWNKPEGYLGTLLISAFVPRRLSHKCRDGGLPLLGCAHLVTSADPQEQFLSSSQSSTGQARS